MTLIVALIGLTGATMRAQVIPASTQPDSPVGILTGRPINGEQLAQMLTAASGEPDEKLAKQLYELELTERLSAATRARCEADLPGPGARRAFRALADRSSFLDPPATEIPVIAEPELEAQRRMLALSADYINKTIHQLPNLYATKVTSSFEHNLKGKKLSRWVSTESAIVRYRDGQEVSGSSEIIARDLGMVTAGEFGPILYAVQQDAAQGDLAWSHWEQGVAAPEAVFRYAVSAGKSHYNVNGQFPAYRGEITVDPSNGMILRLVLMAGPIANLPFRKADFLIEYGPVELGGKTYTCPVKAVALYMEPKLWMLDDIVFEQYHLYRASAKMLAEPSEGP
jgi:hypothetical protein